MCMSEQGSRLQRAPHFSLSQTCTARLLQCCCHSSVVAPTHLDSAEWRWDDPFVSCIPRALPLSIAAHDVVASCAVAWTYESRSLLLFCIPIRSSGWNRCSTTRLNTVSFVNGFAGLYSAAGTVSSTTREATAARPYAFATYVLQPFSSDSGIIFMLLQALILTTKFATPPEILQNKFPRHNQHHHLRAASRPCSLDATSCSRAKHSIYCDVYLDSSTHGRPCKQFLQRVQHQQPRRVV